MVSIQHSATSFSDKDLADTRSWLIALAQAFTGDEQTLIRRACEFAEPLYAGRMELSGTPLLQHARGSASILVGMNMDCETIIATLLHAVPEYRDDWFEVIEADFGSTVRNLVEGIYKIEQIQHFSETQASDKKSKNANSQQVEGLRQMLLAMVQDIRVVLIKLAERTQTLRNLSGAPMAEQQRVAQETQSIFAPLANRLGVWQLKWEMEDLSVRYLEPALYKQIAQQLDERRTDRERYIAEVLVQLQNTLQQAGIKAEVTGRPKHIYSIINKMKRKQLDFNELYDVRAVRILVDDIEDCYSALSLVHELWSPIQSEFDDYIAHPKSNHYRSLHTAVIGPRGLALEVQIRTHEMHQHSELGVAAHWRYKEGAKSDTRFDEKIAWLRQILEWKTEVADKDDMLAQFKNELFQDHVYVLTPQGKVIDLPQGATPVDFAYTLHTDLGHRTRGAKVDGSIVPLNYQLQNAQRVEILTTKIGAPSRDWLNPTLGYLKSSRARAKVRNWFRSQNFDESVAQGRAQLDKELHRLGVVSVNQESIAQQLHFNKLEDLLAAIGRSEVTQKRIELALHAVLPSKVAASKPQQRPPSERTSSTGVLIEGVGNLMTKFAQCCKPQPPDDIIGYVTRDRGITIHRHDCAFLQRTAESRRDRLLQAQWAAAKRSR